MTYLIDIYAVAELLKGEKIAPAAKAFFAAKPIKQFSISKADLESMRYGIKHLSRSDEASADRLDKWLDGVGIRFAGRILKPQDSTLIKDMGLWERGAAGDLVMRVAVAFVNNLIIVTPRPEAYEGATTGIFSPWAGES